MATTAAYRTIGQPVGQIEGVAKVSGKAVYAADIILPGMLWGKMLRSPYPHARIVRIDTAAARALPGVHAVLTSQDLPDYRYGRRTRDMPVLARDRVRFVGEKVAVVAAENAQIAEDAVALIEVEYEELPAVFDALEAMQPNAPRVHNSVADYPGHLEPVPDTPNTYAAQVRTKGDIEQGFRESDRIFEYTFHTQSHHQGYIEPHACILRLNPDGRVELWLSNKTPYAARQQLAAMLGVGREQVLVHVSHVGGDFGGKGSLMDVPLAYHLAHATGHPVKIVMTYNEELMAANPRNPGVLTFKTGVKADGTLVAHHTRSIWNTGAYSAFLPGGIIGGGMGAGGMYRIPHVRLENIGVYTNSEPRGHVRAPGGPQVAFALESHFDMIARELGMDPLQFRLKNALTAGEESPTGEVMRDVRMRETLQAAADAAGWNTPKPANVGRGIAVYDRHVGSGAAAMTLTLDADGSATLITVAPDTGTGSHTILQQIAAETLGIPLAQMRVVVADTDAIAEDGGVGGSRVSHVHGQATLKAAQQVRELLLTAAAGLLGAAPERVTQDATGFSAGDKRTSFADAARAAVLAAGGALRADITFDGGSTAGIACVCAQVAEVEIDPETGQVTVRRFITAHDVGTVLNPLGHQGQIEGGVVQGLGFALTEELMVEDGRVTNLHLGEYKMPVTQDIPELITVLLPAVEGPAPFGGKAVGEMGNCPVAPAVANAVYDAVGVRITSLPITAEKVHRALKQKNG